MGERTAQGLSRTQQGLTWQGSLQAPDGEGGSALTTVLSGWLRGGEVLCGEVISHIPPDARGTAMRDWKDRRAGPWHLESK